MAVSTHSRPKAAAPYYLLEFAVVYCFNTQPPEGGCSLQIVKRFDRKRFNTQPPEGGCRHYQMSFCARHRFNTQPPEGGCTILTIFNQSVYVSTHSRPKAAAQS